LNNKSSADRESAESVLLPPSEYNVTWRFALCPTLPPQKQGNPAPAETGNDKPQKHPQKFGGMK